MTTKKKVPKKETTRELIVSIFTGVKAYKWGCTIGGITIECTKTYTTDAAAKKACKDWIKDNVKT